VADVQDSYGVAFCLVIDAVAADRKTPKTFKQIRSIPSSSGIPAQKSKSVGDGFHDSLRCVDAASRGNVCPDLIEIGDSAPG
jgi:hypothetical protein